MAQTKDNTLVPALAAAALQAGGTTNEGLNLLIEQLVADQVKARTKEAEKTERRAISNAQAAKDERAAIDARQKFCSHLKQDNTTRLAGQILSNGQLSLVCMYCNINYFLPAGPGQTEIPRHLLPPADQIGGAFAN